MNGQTTLKALCMLACAIMIAGCGGSSDPEPEVNAPTTEQLANAKPYPLTTCMISGELLDAMGGAITIIENGQIIKFCCKDCLTEFNMDKEKHLTKLTEVPALPETPEVPKVDDVAVPEVPKI